jgi:uncharacterized protein (TIGR03503 family)
MVKFEWLTWIMVILLITVFSSTTYGQQVEVKYYENDDVTNQIPYFDNRFHIDAQLDEVTLIFYRKSGTPPITLVRPDGSKLKVNNLPDDNVKWFDDRTFDMIHIVKPMPGPWQAVGDIMPNSKIMLVSDVTLKAEPIAEFVFSGETLKLTSQVYNQQLVIDDPHFNEVINLDIDFYSTNNPEFDNFGAKPVEVGSFRDDGRALDEYASDGIFTAEFVLDFSPGEWLAVYRVILPMATRELRQKPIILRPNPIKITVNESTDSTIDHQLVLDIDDSFVDPDSLIFQGNVTYPNRQTESFSILEGKGKARIEDIAYSEPGVHRLSIRAFGQTINGREFRLQLPSFSFNVERIGGTLIPGFENESNNAANGLSGEAISPEQQLKLDQQAAELIAQQQADDLAAEQAAQWQTIMYIVLGNFVIIALGGFIVYLVKRKSS